MKTESKPDDSEFNLTENKKFEVHIGARFSLYLNVKISLCYQNQNICRNVGYWWKEERIPHCTLSFVPLTLHKLNPGGTKKV